MAQNSQNSYPIVFGTIPDDRQCLKNASDVAAIVEDFGMVQGLAGNSGSSFPTQDTTGAQALQLAQQNTAAINAINSTLLQNRQSTTYAVVPAGTGNVTVSWSQPMPTTTYNVSVFFQALSTATLSASFNWWVVQGSQSTTGCTIHFESAPALAAGLTFGWSVTSPPNAMSVGPSISGFNPTSGATGTTVTVYGSGFTGVTEVDFGGIAGTSLSPISDTQLTVDVPVISSGSYAITVQTPSGIVISSSTYTVP